MAHTKASGVTKGNRDSLAKRLGVKVFAGQKVTPGNIIVRQKGTRFMAGVGTKLGGDYTLYAVKEGTVKFTQKLGKKYIFVE
jgi:large subunit ribosomal protein L27